MRHMKKAHKILTALVLTLVMVFGVVTVQKPLTAKAAVTDFCDYGCYYSFNSFIGNYPGYELGVWMVGWYDPNVQMIQRAMRSAWLRGTSTYYLSEADCDGYYGPKTRDGIVYFQNWHSVYNPNDYPVKPHLAVDGIVGPMTWSVLQRHYYAGTPL